MHERPRCEARAAAIRARLPRQREMARVAEARRSLQEGCSRLLLLRPAYEAEAQRADATARQLELAGREELTSLRGAWGELHAAEATLLRGEEAECADDQVGAARER